MKKLLAISLMVAGCGAGMAQETLPPLVDGKAPTNIDELWAGFDPRAEPLDVEVLKEWEEDGVVMKVLRYRIGIFKGEKAMMAGVYGYPKGGTNLPGLVQIHGGGQYAQYQACLTNGKRGYATLSISWAGRLIAPDYHVNPGVVKLFWEGKTNHPHYKVTTDWGALDGYHAPSRYKHGFSSAASHEHTLDAVDSPRNDSWFLATMGARRALTFLERQPEVDGDKLGVYGHSMGGKITVMTAGADDRVVAAAPSCGGVSHRNDKDPLIAAMICDDAYLKKITCPIVFLSPANDFHGRIEDQQTALKEIKSTDWRVTAAAHHQHQDTAEYEVATQLWFDQYLKDDFTWPKTPTHELKLQTPDGMPMFSIVPDASREIQSVDFYYTQQAGEKAANRFWHHVKPTQDGDRWTAPVPILSTDKPLWIYANVVYPLDEAVSGAGYYYGDYTTDIFNLSSPMAIATPEQLKTAGVKATLKPSRMIEDFGPDWEKEWYRYKKDRGPWERNTRKINDDTYLPQAYSKLAFEVRSDKAGQLIVELDKHKAEVDVQGGPDWQPVMLFPTDFTDKEGGSRLDWEGIVNLRLAAGGGFPQSVEAPFQLRTLQWLAGTREELNARRTVRLAEVKPVDGKTYLDMETAEVLTHGHKTVMNTWLDEKSPLVIDGKTYDHGLTTHANFEASYFLGGKFERFHAMALAGGGASVTFEVHVDGQKVFDSGLLNRGQSVPIDLSVKEAQELKLVVTDGGNSKHGDHASWVDAYLLEQGDAADAKPALSHKDYSFGYWLNAFNKPKGDTSGDILCIETGHYGFMLNVTNIIKPRFGLLRDDADYPSALASGSTRLQDLAPADLNVTVEHDGKSYRMVDCWAGEGRRGELRQWESGQIAQHYDARGLRFRDAEGNTLGCSGTLDLVAWPDSLTFNVEVAPDFVYTEGLSEGVVGSGHCVVGKSVDVPHSEEIDPEQLTLECWIKAPETLPKTGSWLLCKNSNEWAEGCFGFGAGGWAPSAIMNIGGGRENQHWIGMGGHHYKKNDWNHLALTYDGNEMKAYLNGHLQGTKTIGKPRRPGNGLLRIGRRADGHSQVAQGLYDQVRVWSRPLTGAEIKAHAAKPDTIPNREALVFEENFESGEVFTAPVWNNAKVRMGFKSGSQDWQHEGLVEGTWKAGEKKQFTLNCNVAAARGDARPPKEEPDATHGGRASPRAVSVRLTSPDQQEFPVVFKPKLNAYVAEIMKLKRPNRGKGPMTGYDEFDLVIECGEETAKPVPFYLHLQNPVSITGLIPILCHADGSPTGVPVQLSKNWHYGSYLRAYALLPVVPGQNHYKLRIAYCGYGTLPPVSHAQLSLVGYGGNQRWCQLALGCGGELITFNPDMSIGGSTAVCDVRLTMAKYGTNPNPWVWTDAGWGGDWLGVFNGKHKLNFAEMKVAYLAHGPCLSDVAYHGAYGSDRSVLIDARVQLPRTDDYGRTFQDLEYRFQRELDTANTYFMKRHGRMYDGVVAYGNADGLIAEKRITGDLKKGDLLVPPTKLEGSGPWWVAFPERSRTGINREWPIGYVSMVVQDFVATFGTNTYSHPFLQVRIVNRLENEAVLETLLVPPPEVKTYQPGDQVKMDTVWLHLVRTADEFGGFNEAFRKHLEENPKSWKTTYREARGNNLEIAVEGGTLLRNLPIVIRVEKPEVSVTIKGGLAFVPIRFEGLENPEGYAVFEVVNGEEKKLDQSVHGNDFWQTDYDGGTKSYKMTFNLPMDGKETSKWVLRKHE